MHSKIFKFFLLECIQGTKVTLVLRVQRRTLFLSMSNNHVCEKRVNLRNSKKSYLLDTPGSFFPIRFEDSTLGERISFQITHVYARDSL